MCIYTEVVYIQKIYVYKPNLLHFNPFDHIKAQAFSIGIMIGNQYIILLVYLCTISFLLWLANWILNSIDVKFLNSSFVQV